MARAANIPPSPPKRATRARTRGTTARDAAVDPNTTSAAVPRARGRPKAQITTEETKKRAVRKPTTSNDRKGRKVDIDMDDGTDDEIGFMSVKEKSKVMPAKGKAPTVTTTAISRTTKNATPSAQVDSDDDDELARSEVPKRKVGRPRTKPTSSDKDMIRPDLASKPTRGRPRTVATVKSFTADGAETDVVEKKPKVRTTVNTKPERRAINTTAPTASTAAKSSLLKEPAKKKKVTFQDVSDSEEEDLTAATATASERKATGLKAKPVRKITAASSRGRKPATIIKCPVQPLSPKKATQVAKSSSSASSDDGNEDELNAAKTDIKLLIKSPSKYSSENAGWSSPVKKINLAGSNLGSKITGPESNENDENVIPKSKAPIDFGDPVFMASPARRLPSSPFHYTMKETPRRTPRVIRDQAKPVSQPDFTMTRISPLKASPKKGNLGASFVQSPLKSSTSFTPKASLFQSPAKRICSPFKATMFPKKNGEPDVVQKDDNIDVDTSVTCNFLADVSSEKDHRLSGEAINHKGRKDDIEIDDVFAEAPVAVELGRKTVTVGQQLQVSSEENRNAAEDSLITTEQKQQEEMQGHGELGGQEAMEEQEERKEQEDMQENKEMEEQGEMKEQQYPEDNDQNVSQVIREGATLLPCVEPGTALVDCRPSFPYQITEAEDTMNLQRVQSTPCPAPSPPTVSPVNQAAYVYRQEGSDQAPDDGSMSDASSSKSKLNRSRHITVRAETPTRFGQDNNEEESTAQGEISFENPGFTPLATQLSQWKISSPEKSQPRRSRRRAVFSLAGRSRSSVGSTRESLEAYQLRLTRRSLASRRSLLADPPTQQRFFEDGATSRSEQEVTALLQLGEEREAPVPEYGLKEMEYRQQQHVDGVVGPLNEDKSEAPPGDEEIPLQGKPGEIADQPLQCIFDTFNEGAAEPFEKDSGEVYRDENTPLPVESIATEIIPFVEDELEENKENDDIIILSVPTTPVNTIPDPPRTVHTVSKVPLRPEGEVSPVKVSRKRTRSLSTGPTTRSSPRLHIPMVRSQTVPSLSPRKPRIPLESPEPKDSHDEDERVIQGETTKARSATANPMNTPQRRITADQQVLRGAVVFVDVHTTEGEDASGIFIELLNQMGARCVKSWSWNPRSSLSPVEGVDPKEGKVGITHVIYKDGGVRTLEKVRQAVGLVKCVGVGWVLDCERENKWLDESHYAVDSSIIPRGGAKRRKSMQPRALSNVNGTLVKVEPSTSSSSGRRAGADQGTMQDFIRITPTSPSSRTGPEDASGLIPTTDERLESGQSHFQLPSTPRECNFQFDFEFDTSCMSPATPYYLSKGAKLVQRTCPPKQTQQSLFQICGPVGDELSGKLGAKLEAARRKSLVFKPKIGSPLGR